MNRSQKRKSDHLSVAIGPSAVTAPEDAEQMATCTTPQAWCATAGSIVERTGRPITDVFVVRLSSRDKWRFINDLQTNLDRTNFNENEDVAIARSVGGAVVEQNGGEIRKQLGVFRVEMRHLDSNSNSTSLVGFMTLFGSSVFLYILDSAAMRNVTPVFPMPRGNAYTMTVLTALQVLGPRTTKECPLHVHFRDEGRIARDELFHALIFGAIRERGARAVVAGRVLDPSEIGERFNRAVAAVQSANDRDLRVVGLGGGKAKSILRNTLPESILRRAPFTHMGEQEVWTDSNGFTTVKNSGRLVLVPRAAEILDDVAAEVARQLDKGPSVHAAFERAALVLGPRHGLTSKSPSRSGPPTPLHEMGSPGAALERYFSDDAFYAWEHGKLRYSVTLAKDDPTITSHLVRTELPDGRVHVSGEIDCIRPECVPTENLHRIQVALQQSGITGVHHSGWRRAFLSKRYEVEGEVFEFSLRQASVYRVLDQKGRHIASFNPAALHRAVGLELALLLEASQAGPLSLHRSSDPPLDDHNTEALLRLERDLAAAEAQLAEDRAVAEGAMRHWLLCDPTSSEEAKLRAVRDRYAADRDDREAMVRQIKEEIRVTGRAVRAAVNENPSAEFSRIETVAAALQADWIVPGRTKNEGLLPPEAVLAVEKVFMRTHEMTPVGDGGSWRFRALAHLPLLNGGHAVRTIIVEVPNTRRSGAASTIGHGQTPQNAAYRVMVLGQTREQVAAEWNRKSGKQNSALGKALLEWLATPRVIGGVERCIPSADLRRVILDAPLEVRRVIYAYLSGDAAIAQDLPNPWREHIVNVFTAEMAWSEGWCSSDFSDERVVLDLIKRQLEPARGVNLVDAARALGRDAKRTERLTRKVRPATVVRPALAQPPAFVAGWDRYNRSPASERRLLPHRCPHRDCEGRMVHGEATLALHVLFVPEVPDGILCLHCMRMPSNATVRFPGTYAQMWTRRTLAIDGTRVGSLVRSTGLVADI